jgi:hypothetical protein
LTGILWLVCGTWRTHAMGYVLFASLLCGVLDEFLQSFTGRGTSVRDVMLDFGGALIGIVCAPAVTFENNKKTVTHPVNTLKKHVLILSNIIHHPFRCNICNVCGKYVVKVYI